MDSIIPKQLHPDRPRHDHHIWWLLVLAICGFLLYFHKDQQVFPSASIDLKVPRSEITRIAESWARTLGYDKPKTIKSTIFAADNDAKTFLEYELGLNKANELMRDELPVWYWRTRFCKQYEQEQFKVWLSPAGRLLAFSHHIENDRVLPTVSKTEAQIMAESFIERQAQLKLSHYKLIKDASHSQPHRTDYSFVWEDTKRDYKEAKTRISVYVAGNQVTSLDYSLHVPEKWERKFSTIRSYNNLLQSGAQIFYQLLNFAALFVFLWAVTTGNIRWKFAIVLGCVFGLMNMLDAVNDFATAVDDYSPNTSYQNYLIQFALSTLLSGFGLSLIGAGLFGGSESLYRMSYPWKVALENAWKALSSRQLLCSLLVGHLAFAIDLGWVVFYYLIGEHFHFWCPLGVDNYEVLSSAFPFYSAVMLGVKASLFEELVFRIVGLSLAQKLFKNFWLANLFQAAAWGFMHSTYPQQPAFARGIELTAAGLFSGYILRRYGIIACLVQHYLFDAFLDCKPLFAASDPTLKFSPLAAILPFAVLGIAGLVFALKRRSFLPEDPFANSQVLTGQKTKSIVEPGQAEPFRYTPLSKKIRSALLIITVLFIPIAVIVDFPAVGVNWSVSTNRNQALTKGREVFLSHKTAQVFPLTACWLTVDKSSEELQYVYEQKKNEVAAKRSAARSGGNNEGVAGADLNKMRAERSVDTAEEAKSESREQAWRGAMRSERGGRAEVPTEGGTGALTTEAAMEKNEVAAKRSAARSGGNNEGVAGADLNKMCAERGVDTAEEAKSESREQAWRGAMRSERGGRAEVPTEGGTGALTTEMAIKRTMELANLTQPGYEWKVRFCKEFEPEEYEVILDGKGRQISFDVTKAEDAPGARLSKEHARKLVEDFIKRQHPEFVPYEFVTASENRRKERTDHSCTFKVPKYKVGDADFKISASVIGDTVSGFNQGWDLPDKWRWERAKKKLKDEVLGHVRSVFSIALVLFFLWWAFGVLRSGAIRWRLAALFAIPFAMLAICQEINDDLLNFIRFYDTTTPMNSYLIKTLFGYLQGGIGKFAEYGIYAAFAFATYRLLFQHSSLSSLLLASLKPDNAEGKGSQKQMWLDAILIASAATGVHLMLATLWSLGLYLFSPGVTEDSLDVVSALANVALPSFDCAYDSFTAAVRSILTITIAAGLYAKYCRRTWLFFLFILVQALISASDHRYWQDYVLNVLYSFANGTMWWFLVTKLAKRNFLAYFLFSMNGMLLLRMNTIARHGMGIQNFEFSFMTVLLLLPFVYYLYLNAQTREMAH